MKTIALLILSTFFSWTFTTEQAPKPIHVEVSGNGNPIIFIPGFTVPGEVWNPVVKELEKTYECHVVTLAGFGGKAPIGFPWLPKVNDALQNYISKNNLENATIIGHSLGGTIATWLACRENSKVSNIIIVDALPAAGALMIPDFNPDNLAYDSPYNNQQLAMDDAQFEQMATMMSQGMSMNKEAQEDIKKWIMTSDRKTYVYGYTDYLKLDLREDLKNINIPTTIIAAPQPFGKEVVTKNYQDQYANLKDYNFILAEDAAHFVMLDQPEWFLRTIKTILSNQ
ncbi:alpha/beta fold hydrolase [Winogradskyella aquimaris]|uniref:Alpha/beta hydrolase n=1 Tax=Winogradskyella aquimaris TaxID=864074 RepID=A0ABU5ENY3_9FLAO|nr:alpha/beta hydrolase [Winogradskyella aquimaris]MDY2587983.1 alpha/beta hydrolase [Winogradskyella aquimaris]